MPFVANTPESLLARSDSKDPKSTCRGLTSAGRPCRRSIGTRPDDRAATRCSNDARRYLQVVPGDDLADESLYCWQHKEQASIRSAQSSPGGKAGSCASGRPTMIREERTSLDTLADRLGLVDVGDKYSAGRQAKPGRRPQGGAVGGGAYSAGYQTTPPIGPFRPPPPPKREKRNKVKPQPTNQLQFCFCFSIPLEEMDEEQVPEKEKPNPKPRPTNQPYRQQPMLTYQPQRPSVAPYPAHYRPASSKYSNQPQPQPSPSKSAKSATSITAQMKHLIPDSLDAATASALMAELVRPLADSDEPGFVYMFRLVQGASTSTAAAGPQRAPVEAARSFLLAPPSSGDAAAAAAAQGQHASDTVSRHASQSHRSGGARPGGQPPTLLLKIGRAANVQRRMNQWQRQCGYDVEVLRYYPYTSCSSSSATPTPNAKRVERLVHIELAGMGLRAKTDTCAACGRDHREWFEVGATREDMRIVDAVIRRWVEWDCRGHDE